MSNLKQLLLPRSEDIKKILLEFNDTTSQPLSNFGDSLEKNLLFLKMMNDEMCDHVVPAPEQAERCLNGMLKETDEAKTHIPLGVTTESFIARKSCFTKSEQHRLFEFLLLVQNKLRPTKEQADFFEEHKTQLNNEQEDYLRYAKQQWLTTNYKRHSVIRDDVLKFVNECWKAKLERIDYWPKYYEEACSVSLGIDSEISMKFVDTALTIGSKRLPVYRYIKVDTDRLNVNDYISSLIPDKTTKRLSGHFKCLNRYVPRRNYDPNITRDANASSIALINDVHVVMTESTFCTLINNHSGRIQPWKLPVVIKELGHGERAKKIVFIGKKLPPHEMNMRDRVEYFTKKGIQSIFLTKPLRANDESLNRHIDKLLELESEASKDPGRPTENPQNESHGAETDGNTSKKKEGDEKTSTKKIECRTHYNLFECMPVDVGNVLMKNALTKKYNILIRITDKGVITKDGEQMVCKIIPKLEYQSELGFEIMTPEGISKEWGSLFVRPNATLKRVRINPVAGDLLKWDHLSLDDIIRDAKRTHGLVPNSKLGIVYNAVNTLWNLPVGNYLMARDATESIVATIYKGNENSRRFNLSACYQSSKPEFVSIEKALWVPLDKTTLSPVSHYFHQPPCTFTPITKRVATQKPEGNPSKSKKKKKKKTGNRKLADPAPQPALAPGTEKGKRGGPPKKPRLEV